MVLHQGTVLRPRRTVLHGESAVLPASQSRDAPGCPKLHGSEQVTPIPTLWLSLPILLCSGNAPLHCRGAAGGIE